MIRFAVFGASGCGRGIMPLVREQLERSQTQRWDLVFVDDRPPATTLNGQRVLTFSQWMEGPAESRQVVVAVADSRARERIVARCASEQVAFFEVRAANVVVMDQVDIGEGAVLCPFVTLTSNIRIGRHFHANLYSYVEHDCVIGDFVTFAPAVHCNGNVVIEDHAYVGAGAVLRQGRPGSPLVIGRGAVVGMGAVVTRSVAPGHTVVGNPARPMHSDSG
jgi:sugar O-acyltransferase (sialic acid O-acetyltransferase NeuD family)